MLSATRLLKDLAPIRITAIATHVGGWVFSNSGDVHIENPLFNKDGRDEVHMYCIHGTCDRAHAFQIMANRMMQGNMLPDSIAAVHLVTFDKRGHGLSIEDFAVQLRDKIQKNHHQNVIIMGHSRGGIVAAYFTENLAAESNISVKGVIALCSPFRGSHCALPPFTFLSHSVNELKIDSPFLETLCAKVTTSETPYYYFTAKYDEIVAPDRCYPEEHKDRSEMSESKHGHLSILRSHKLLNSLQNRLMTICHVVSNNNEYEGVTP